METKRDRQFNFRISSEELSQVKALAKYFGISDPDAIRLCIEKTIMKVQELDPNWNKKHTPQQVFDKRKEML